MQPFSDFFSWWSKTFRSKGCIGKIFFGGISLFALCFLCSVYIGLTSPKTSTPSTRNFVTQTAKPGESLQPTTPSDVAVTEAFNLSTPSDVCVYCNMECPTSQGGAYFCLADSQLVADQVLFEETLRTHCDFQVGDFCEVLVWTDAIYVPSSFPMTDEQVNNQVADYTRNKNTGYDCFTLFSAGQIIYQSDGCS